MDKEKEYRVSLTRKDGLFDVFEFRGTDNDLKSTLITTLGFYDNLSNILKIEIKCLKSTLKTI